MSKNINPIGAIIEKSERSFLKSAKAKRQVIDYKIAKSAFMRIMQLELFKKGIEFKVNGNNILVIQELLKYFINDPTGKLDQRKSIYLFGPMGAGKDFLMSCFSQFLEELQGNDNFQVVTTVNVYQDIKNREKKVADYLINNICFSELGYEPKLAYKTGEVPIMEHILFQRHFQSTNGELKTHITSNYRPESLTDLYDQRIEERAKQLWNFVFLNGRSLR